MRDISTREDWNATYGMTIPVLTFLDAGEERKVCFARKPDPFCPSGCYSPQLRYNLTRLRAHS